MPNVSKLFAVETAAWRVAVALLLIHAAWGTTYFAVSVALCEMPPLWLNASRYSAAGAALLALERDFSATLAGALMAFGAPLAWSMGSYASQRLVQPALAMAAGLRWLVGGLICAAVAAPLQPVDALLGASAHAWMAWGYLLALGTLVALKVDLWPLKHGSAALAGGYSFVNPAVALLAGTVLGGERLSGRVWLALPLIFAALALIMDLAPALSGESLAALRSAWHTARRGVGRLAGL